VRAFVGTEAGAFVVDLDEEVVLLDEEADPPTREDVHVDLPLVVAASRAGSTVVAVVDRRPPLMVSHDAGRTWRESGGGLPRGTAVAVDAANPDRVLYAARNRLYVSTDGGRFWRALAPELPAIEAVAWEETPVSGS
jgi:photosystem II stability/assembly factor-like uncharacterized protein